MAPHAIVTNKKGIIGGPVLRFVIGGAIILGWAIKIDRYIRISPTISWWLLI